MTTAPPRPCPRCGRVQAGPCPTCRRPDWATVSHETARIRGRRLQQLRHALFRAQPFCVLCRSAVATVRDHIQSLAEGGLDVPENTQAICEPCHQQKTTAESQRGMIRHRR